MVSIFIQWGCWRVLGPPNFPKSVFLMKDRQKRGMIFDDGKRVVRWKIKHYPQGHALKVCENWKVRIKQLLPKYGSNRSFFCSDLTLVKKRNKDKKINRDLMKRKHHFSFFSDMEVPYRPYCYMWIKSRSIASADRSHQTKTALRFFLQTSLVNCDIPYGKMCG